MADIGIRVSRKGQDASSAAPTGLSFSSSILLDKIMVIAVGTNPSHGLGYKPTILVGDRSASPYVDNTQLNGNSGNTKVIILAQQGS